MYNIEVSAAAQRDIKKLPREAALRIAKVIDGLAADPRPRGVKKLTGDEELCRVRMGDFRVIYRIEDRRLVVLVVRVRNRRDVYR